MPAACWMTLEGSMGKACLCKGVERQKEHLLQPVGVSKVTSPVPSWTVRQPMVE